MSGPDGERVRCHARIWPSSWSGWGQCPGYVMPDGNCSAYGSQHRVEPLPRPDHDHHTDEQENEHP